MLPKSWRQFLGQNSSCKYLSDKFMMIPKYYYRNIALVLVLRVLYINQREELEFMEIFVVYFPWNYIDHFYYILQLSILRGIITFCTL